MSRYLLRRSPLPPYLLSSPSKRSQKKVRTLLSFAYSRSRDICYVCERGQDTGNSRLDNCSRKGFANSDKTCYLSFCAHHRRGTQRTCCMYTRLLQSTVAPGS